jgi:F-type H+-transporting ATPase subunit epsilon
MGMTIHVDIVSAEKQIFSGRAELIVATTIAGEIGILPRHAPLLTSLKPGQIRLTLLDNKEEVYYVSGGLLEVQPHTVTILADTVERAGDLDEAAAMQAQEAAEKAMASRTGEFEYAKAAAELAEAVARVQAIKQMRKKVKG